MTSKPKADGPPSVAGVRRALGLALAAWDALLDPARKRTTEWKRYSKKHPWSVILLSAVIAPLFWGAVGATRKP